MCVVAAIKTFMKYLKHKNTAGHLYRGVFVLELLSQISGLMQD